MLQTNHKINILGINIDNITFSETFNKIGVFLNSPDQHYIVTPNPEFIIEAQNDEEFKKILNQADLSISDGFGLLLATRFIIKERICGVDLMEKICEYSSKINKKVFLLGALNGAAEKTVKNLQYKYPNLKAESLENYENCESAILTFKPDVLFVALGAPKQEKWIYKNLNKFPSVKIAVGVGGAFDFLSGNIRRAPRWMRKIGMEWLWRLTQEPQRIKRILKATIEFPLLVWKKK